MVNNPPWMSMRTLEQNDLLQPACRDLSKQLTWFGHSLSQDEWRHLICAAVLRVKIVPGINTGDGAPGIVTLGGSSRKLNKAQATEAIQLAFAIGDAPWEYEPTQRKAVHWCDKVWLARGFNPAEMAE